MFLDTCGRDFGLHLGGRLKVASCVEDMALSSWEVRSLGGTRMSGTLEEM